MEGTSWTARATWYVLRYRHSGQRDRNYVTGMRGDVVGNTLQACGELWWALDYIGPYIMGDLVDITLRSENNLRITRFRAFAVDSVLPHLV